MFLNVKHLYLLKFTEWFRRFFLPIIGFAKNKAGCCLVLRGGTRKELAKVKCVMKQFLLLKTHATFEKAFLLDEPSQVQFFFVNFRFLSFLLNLKFFVKSQRSVLKFLIEHFFFHRLITLLYLTTKIVTWLNYVFHLSLNYRCPIMI